MSIFSLFSGKPAVSKPVKVTKKPVKKTVSIEEKKVSVQELDRAQAQAREIILEARDEAMKIKEAARVELLDVKEKVATARQQLGFQRQDLDKLSAKLEERDRYTRTQAETIQKRLLEVEEV